MPRVTLENVTKSYPAGRKGMVTAVRDTSLMVSDRELLALVGPSGSGKTTLLRLIAGLEAASAGLISIDSQVVSNRDPMNGDVAMVFQNFALYPHMTVRENLGFPLKLRSVPGRERSNRVNETAELLGLVHCLDRLPRALSGGERQRVAVGRAIIRRPRILLLDEPLSNLDAPMRLQMRLEIARLHRHIGATTIYVTHDQVEAMALGDRIAVLHDGTIHQVAEPRVLYRRPATVFVAGFIGSPPMNLIRGHLQNAPDGWHFCAPTGTGSSVDLPLPLEAGNCLDPHGRCEVILGCRPEHVRLARMDADGKEGSRSVIQARTEFLEPLGAETCLHARFGPHRIAARLPGDIRVPAGAMLHLEIDLGEACLFDPVLERLIR